MNKRTTRIFAVMTATVLLCMTMATANAVEASSAPVAENLELTTYRCVSVGGQLAAVDPEGDVVKFEITTAPSKGELEVSDDGSFVYTPLEGKKGKDYFGYRAIDSDGNVSQEATVIIRIEKQKTTISYTDLEGSGSQYAAITLAENDVFVAECLGGTYLFDAEREVTRAEFLAMCMKVADKQLLSGVKSTGFLDDDDIADWAKPYVSTALMTGVISGVSQTSGAVFYPNDAISYSEAAVILNNVLGVANVSTTSTIVDVAPVWAYQAVANMNACNVLPSTTTNMSASLSREDAAELLTNAMELIRNR